MGLSLTFIYPGFKQVAQVSIDTIRRIWRFLLKGTPPRAKNRLDLSGSDRDLHNPRCRGSLARDMEEALVFFGEAWVQNQLRRVVTHLSSTAFNTFLGHQGCNLLAKLLEHPRKPRYPEHTPETEFPPLKAGPNHP